MNCPRCGARMIKVGIDQLVGTKIFITLECQGCHHRVEQEQKKPAAPI